MTSRAASADFEDLLRRALQPVEPPEDLALRLQETLVSLTEAAADELEAWELAAMRDPRNWARPAAAVIVGAGAGAALVALRLRGRARAEAKDSGLGRLLERTARGALDEARRVSRTR